MNSLWLITSAMTLFPSEIPFWGLSSNIWILDGHNSTHNREVLSEPLSSWALLPSPASNIWSPILHQNRTSHGTARGSRVTGGCLPLRQMGSPPSQETIFQQNPPRSESCLPFNTVTSGSLLITRRILENKNQPSNYNSNNGWTQAGFIPSMQWWFNYLKFANTIT